MIPYVLQQASSSVCRDCHKYLKLLIEKGEVQFFNLPAFYICFDCKKVFQVGIGELELIKENE